MIETILGVLLVLILISLFVPAFAAFRVPGGLLGLVLLVVLIWLLVSGGS